MKTPVFQHDIRGAHVCMQGLFMGEKYVLHCSKMSRTFLISGSVE